MSGALSLSATSRMFQVVRFERTERSPQFGAGFSPIHFRGLNVHQTRQLLGWNLDFHDCGLRLDILERWESATIGFAQLSTMHFSLHSPTRGS